MEGIKISPQTLIFSNNINATSSQKLKVYNRSDLVVCFKLKPSVPHKYHLSQMSGKLHHGEMSHVIVTLQSHNMYVKRSGAVCDYLYVYISDSNTKELISQKTIVLQILNDCSPQCPRVCSPSRLMTNFPETPVRGCQCCRTKPVGKCCCIKEPPPMPCRARSCNPQICCYDGCTTYCLIYEHRWKMLWLLVMALCILIIITPLNESQKTYDYIFRLVPSFCALTNNTTMKYFAWFILVISPSFGI